MHNFHSLRRTVEPSTAHDIFLSHSGAQKQFVKDLYKELSRNFSAFFDITHHSLPLGENFPKHIFSAARRCKVAAVILSEEFVCSKWPMLELSAFVDVLPLFFKLSPLDLKTRANLKRWGKKWKTFAKQDPRIVVSKWENALKILGSHNGLTFNAATESELAYLERIVSGISQIVPPAIKYDAHHIQGKDRLCQVILDKYKKMDCHEILQYDSLELPTSTNLPLAPRPKVLGSYGLPGSGKSTLCKILKDHFFPIYAGKSLYMELPTNPSLGDLVNKFKLLLRFTDFRDRINLDEVSELEQVEWLLRSYQLQSCSVFLVVDNISDKSWAAVQKILLVGFGPRSNIVLVARTLDILLPVLKSLKSGHHCTCDSMCIPNVDEMEAKEILLQTTRSGSVDLDGYVPQQHLAPEQTEIVLRIVRLCGFGPENSQVYLPLVMKIVGGMLIKYKGDLEEWGRDQQRFWAGVKNYKEDAVKELVEESFKTLPNEGLQVLFMDVALFILPSKLQGFHEVCSLLGFMHERSASRMEQMLKDLERYCFLTVSEDGVSVHDVYLEFAEYIQEDSSGLMKWSWRNDTYADGRVLLLKEDQTMKHEHQQVRTMILNEEGCEKVELQSLLGLKAVVVRDCKTLVLLSLAGLSSLVSLEIGRCPSLRQIECRDNDYTSLHNMKRFILVPQTKGERSRVLLQVPYLWPFSYLLQRVIAPAKHSNLLDISLASHMKGLQVLSLEGTGIRRLGDISSCWPQLQDLTINEGSLQSFEVGNLPRLKRFHFNGNYESETSYSRDSEGWRRKGGNPRLNMLQGKNLLVGCPELEQVVIQSALFEGGELGTLPQSLLALELSYLYTAKTLPDISSSSRTLERLSLRNCEELERVNLLVNFRNLRDLELWGCLNVVEVSGLGFLPSLRKLRVFDCPMLRALVGLDSSKVLKKVYVRNCSELQEIARLSVLMGLEKLEVSGCQNLTSLVSAEFENLTKLKTLTISLSSEQSGCISLKNLKNLEELDLDFGSGTAIVKMGGLFEGLESLVKLRTLRLRRDASAASNQILLLDFSSLVGWVPVDNSSGFCSMQRLSFQDWPELAGMDGIQHIVTLTSLHLINLQNLKSLKGLQFLIHLRELSLQNCPLLAELPSLHALVNMRWLEIRKCSKIKALEGCNEMKGLQVAQFDGCESLSCLPFSDVCLLQLCNLQFFSFRGCKFASNMERVVAWVVEDKNPRPLRLASLCNLVWQYYRNASTYTTEKEQVVDALFPCLFNRLLPDDDNCFNFQCLLNRLEERWNDEESFFANRFPFPRAAAQELVCKLKDKPKKDLLQNFQMHKLSVLRFLDDAQVAGILVPYSSLILKLLL